MAKKLKAKDIKKAAKYIRAANKNNKAIRYWTLDKESLVISDMVLFYEIDLGVKVGQVKIKIGGVIYTLPDGLFNGIATQYVQDVASLNKKK